MKTMKCLGSTDGGRMSTDGGCITSGWISTDGLDGGQIWGFGPVEIISSFGPQVTQIV